MGALIQPLPCRFDCDYEYEAAVSSGTQGNCSSGTRSRNSTENQGNSMRSPRLQKHLKSKRKPNASVKTAEALVEAANARKVAMESDYQQIAQFREGHRATMSYRKKEHILKMKVLRAKLEHYNLLNKKN
ncbi:hypothetical protein TNCV_4267981 [Trichonephila clavipes]|nr:hypothetical protein TNCV_4267981 [Trichonephila clavipes]